MSKERQPTNERLTTGSIQRQETGHDLGTARGIAAELRRLRRLHALGVELLAPGDTPTFLEKLLRATLDITGADKGNIQLADDRGTLTIATHVGFGESFLAAFARVDSRMDSVCDRALATRKRAVVEDVMANPLFVGSPALSVWRAAGVRAVQFTPLFSHAGSLIGMLSTHYGAPHSFGEAETLWLDLLATRATRLIDRARLEQQLRDTAHTLEEQVAARTRDLQVALDGAKAGTWRIDLRSKQVTWDERSRAMFGAEAAGTQPFDATFSQAHPDDRPRLRKRLEEMQTPGDDRWDMTFQLVHQDGTVVSVQGVGRAERDVEGHMIALSGINLDLTGQKQVEQALIESQSHEQEATEALESLFAATAEGILTQTPQGVITRANPALHVMFGYRPGELIGQSVEQLVPESARSAHTQERARFWRERRSRQMGAGRDLTGRRKDGTTFPVEVSLTHTATPPPHGRVFAFVSDITARKRAEDQLRQSHAALQEQASQLRHRSEQLRRLASDLTITEQRAREQLAKRVHDDLQQLLFSAKLRVDRLVSVKPGATVDVASRLERAQSELEQAIAAARSLSVELFPPQLHERGLVAAINWLATWMKEKYGLMVDVTADSNATLDKKDFRTLAFESVRELLFDVVKHAQISRATVDLALTADNAVQISVTDEGVGFDPVAVFSRMGQNVGWGLFTIRERAELLGGRLDVESAPGRGSRFTLVMPRGEGPARMHHPPLRILIADDHMLARAGLREILAERPEFEIVGEASTGTEAVRLAQTLKPDAVIMDVSMPEMDGVEATRRIHAALPATQVFGFSTQEYPEGLHAIEKAGAAGYFRKGDDAQLLIERLLSLRAERSASA